MDEQMIELTPIAAAVVDIWMGGDKAWRARLNDSDFLESADWQNAMEIARAAHSVIAGKVAELRVLAAEMHDHARQTKHTGAVWKESWTVVNDWASQIDAALAPHPKARNEHHE